MQVQRDVAFGCVHVVRIRNGDNEAVLVLEVFEEHWYLSRPHQR